jgi:hypothetical protein
MVCTVSQVDIPQKSQEWLVGIRGFQITDNMGKQIKLQGEQCFTDTRMAPVKMKNDKCWQGAMCVGCAWTVN